MGIFDDQKEFMRLGAQIVDKSDYQQRALYATLVDEEAKEFAEAIEQDDVVESIKEAIDVIVVAAGYLISCGIDAQKAWDLVHATNMAKVEGGVQKREDGKILKSEKYLMLKGRLMDDIRGLL